MIATIRSSLATALSLQNIRAVVWQTLKSEFRFVYSEQSSVIETVGKKAGNILIAGVVVALTALLDLYIYTLGDSTGLTLALLLTAAVWLLAAERVCESFEGVLGLITAWTIALPSLTLLSIHSLDSQGIVVAAWDHLSAAFSFGFGIFTAMMIARLTINFTIAAFNDDSVGYLMEKKGFMEEQAHIHIRERRAAERAKVKAAVERRRRLKPFVPTRYRRMGQALVVSLLMALIEIVLIVHRWPLEVAVVSGVAAFYPVMFLVVIGSAYVTHQGYRLAELAEADHAGQHA